MLTSGVMYIASHINKLTNTVWDYCMGTCSFMSYSQYRLF